MPLGWDISTWRAGSGQVDRSHAHVEGSCSETGHDPYRIRVWNFVPEPLVFAAGAVRPLTSTHFKNLYHKKEIVFQGNLTTRSRVCLRAFQEEFGVFSAPVRDRAIHFPAGGKICIGLPETLC